MDMSGITLHQMRNWASAHILLSFTTRHKYSINTVIIGTSAAAKLTEIYTHVNEKFTNKKSFIICKELFYTLAK
jgi:hypothetical protein